MPSPSKESLAKKQDSRENSPDGNDLMLNVNPKQSKDHVSLKKRN